LAVVGSKMPMNFYGTADFYKKPEYIFSHIRYLLDKFEKSPPPFATRTLTDAFRFNIETRLRDCASGRVGYRTTEDVSMCSFCGGH
jgi:uncharacterized UBP type Zn finger protein